MSIEVLGTAKVARTLDSLATAVSRDVWNGPVTEIVGSYAKEAQQRAPEDIGALKASIEGVVEGQGSERSAILRASAAYAPFVEFGTTPHFVPARYISGWAQRHGFGPRGLKVRGKAQPFFRRNENESLRDVGGRILSDIRAAVIEMIRGKM
jgi:hypothetical protein